MDAHNPDTLTTIGKKAMETFLSAFNHELSLYSKIDQFNEPWMYYSERPLLGFFANAIVRNNQDWTALHEYKVKRKSGHGRCDLYLSNGKCSFLIEAKYNYSTYGILEWDKHLFDAYNNVVVDQLLAYNEGNSDDGFEQRFAVTLLFHAYSSCEPTYFEDIYKKRQKPDMQKLVNQPDYFYKIIRPLGETNNTRPSALEVIGQVREIKETSC